GAIDYQWPGHLAVGSLNLRKPWATVARDAAGGIALRQLLMRLSSGGEGGAGAPAPPPATDVSIGELRVHDGTLTVLDGTVTPTARLALTGIGLTVKNAGWPARGPAQIALEATLPGGGTLTANGTGELDQRVVRVKVGAKNVDVTQLQPYVPIRGNLQARVDAELDVDTRERAGAKGPGPQARGRHPRCAVRGRRDERRGRLGGAGGAVPGTRHAARGPQLQLARPHARRGDAGHADAARWTAGGPRDVPGRPLAHGPARDARRRGAVARATI